MSSTIGTIRDATNDFYKKIRNAQLRWRYRSIEGARTHAPDEDDDDDDDEDRQLSATATTTTASVKADGSAGTSASASAMDVTNTNTRMVEGTTTVVVFADLGNVDSKEDEDAVVVAVDTSGHIITLLSSSTKPDEQVDDTDDDVDDTDTDTSRDDVDGTVGDWDTTNNDSHGTADDNNMHNSSQYNKASDGLYLHNYPSIPDYEGNATGDGTMVEQ